MTPEGTGALGGSAPVMMSWASLSIKNSNDRNSSDKLFLLFPCLPRATLEAMARPVLQVNG